MSKGGQVTLASGSGDSDVRVKLKALPERRVVRTTDRDSHCDRASDRDDYRTCRYLDLRNNSLNGSLAQAISTLSTLSSLRYLYLSGNAISGTIPASISALSAMNQLDVSMNALSGSLPATIGQLSTLRCEFYRGLEKFKCDVLVNEQVQLEVASLPVKLIVSVS